LTTITKKLYWKSYSVFFYFIQKIVSEHKLVIKDAARQILGRIISALCGFIVIKIISPYLGTLRYGDYSTILKYFAIFSALADFGLYVIAVKRMWVIKNQVDKWKITKETMKNIFGKFVGTRIFIMSIVYVLALIIAYFLPAYTSNIFLIRGLPIGMIFSAGFMTAWILQLPLQLFRKMEKLSIGLIFARISQILVLILTVYIFFQKAVNCSPEEFCLQEPKYNVLAFSLILFSVLASITTQAIYVRRQSNKYLKLRIKFDFKFIKEILTQNFQYWLSYFLSSFHTLIVLIFLSNFFPSSQGFEYTWIRALALALIEIFLIVPSALWNSLLHKVGAYSTENKRKSFWNFLTLIFRIWWIVFLNFLLFNTEIIGIISSNTFLWTWLSNPGTNTILPFLSIVLRLSFIKQVFNYLFVATDRQNLLLRINLIGVTFGISLWLYLIPKYNIVWWIITQITLEFLFVIGALFVAFKQKIFPIIPRKKLFQLAGILLIWTISNRFLRKGIQHINREKYKIFIEIWFTIFCITSILINKKNLPLPSKFRKTKRLILWTIIISIAIITATELTDLNGFRIYATTINFIIILSSLPKIKLLAYGLTSEK